MKYDFFFKWGETLLPWNQCTTQQLNPSRLYPVDSKQTMKLLVQKPPFNPSSTTGTKEGTFLHQKLQKEFKRAQLMTSLCSQMEEKLQQTSHSSKQKHKRKRPRKHKRRHYSSTSSSSSNTTYNSSNDSTD